MVTKYFPLHFASITTPIHYYIRSMKELHEEFDTIFGYNLTFSYASLIFGLVAGILILIFMNPLLSLLGSSENTWQYAKDYLFYIAIGAPFILFSNSFGHAVRGEGAARASMIGGMIGTVANIIL